MKLTALIGAALVLALGCGSSDEMAGEIASDGDVDAAERFTAFELPWLGRDFEGMPLAIVDLPAGHRGPAYLIYGDCNEVDPGSGCTYELDIQVDPAYHRGRGALPRRRIDDVPARWESGELHLFGKGLVVSIDGRRRQVVRAAEALEPVNDTPPSMPRLR